MVPRLIYPLWGGYKYVLWDMRRICVKCDRSPMDVARIVYTEHGKLSSDFNKNLNTFSIMFLYLNFFQKFRRLPTISQSLWAFYERIHIGVLCISEFNWLFSRWRINRFGQIFIQKYNSIVLKYVLHKSNLKSVNILTKKTPIYMPID